MAKRGRAFEDDGEVERTGRARADRREQAAASNSRAADRPQEQAATDTPAVRVRGSVGWAHFSTGATFEIS